MGLSHGTDLEATITIAQKYGQINYVEFIDLEKKGTNGTVIIKDFFNGDTVTFTITPYEGHYDWELYVYATQNYAAYL